MLEAEFHPFVASLCSVKACKGNCIIFPESCFVLRNYGELIYTGHNNNNDCIYNVHLDAKTFS